MVGIDVVRMCALKCGHKVQVRAGIEVPMGMDISSHVEKAIAEHSMKFRKGICGECNNVQAEENNSESASDDACDNDSTAGTEADGASEGKRPFLRLSE